MLASVFPAVVGAGTLAVALIVAIPFVLLGCVIYSVYKLRKGDY